MISSGFGRVFFAQSTIDKQKVAIKKMSHVTEKEILANLSEIGIRIDNNSDLILIVGFLTLFKHPNIVRYIGGYRVKREIWVCKRPRDVLEICSGDLYWRLYWRW
jgi:serine/threonine protein kinase